MKITDLRGIELFEGDEVLVELASPKLFAKVFKVIHGGVKLPNGGESQPMVLVTVLVPCAVARVPGQPHMAAPALVKLPNAQSEALASALAETTGPQAVASPFEKPKKWPAS